jgi:hypothetical protein
MQSSLRVSAGKHGFNGYVPGTMPLVAGLHTIEIDYFQVRTSKDMYRIEPQPVLVNSPRLARAAFGDMLRFHGRAVFGVHYVTTSPAETMCTTARRQGGTLASL